MSLWQNVYYQQMQVLLLRHAQTGYNEHELINGQVDEPLSDAGRAQLAEIASLVKYDDFNIIYSSPLIRALDTAKAVSGAHTTKIVTDKRLTEANCGSFSGKPWDSTIPVFGLASSALFSSGEYNFTEFGGESSAQVRKRVESFISDLKIRSDETPLIVTHGGIIRMFYEICEGKIPDHVPHAEVIHLKVN
jgi:broad specificity phosphatase PhoE